MRRIGLLIRSITGRLGSEKPHAGVDSTIAASVAPVEIPPTIPPMATRELAAGTCGVGSERPCGAVVAQSTFNRLVAGSNPAGGTRRTDFVGACLIAATLALLVALLVAHVRTEPAGAHVLNPVACRIVWEQAPAGEKWSALQECVAMQHQHALEHQCRPPRPVVRGITVKGHPGGSEQRRNVTIALNTGRAMRTPPSHMVALIAGATQEDALRNQPEERDHDSVGFLQLRAIHGTHRERMDIAFSTRWFLWGIRSIDPRGTARLESTSKYRRDWGLIQRQQRSAHPLKYNQWIPEARRTYRAFLGGCPR